MAKKPGTFRPARRARTKRVDNRQSANSRGYGRSHQKMRSRLLAKRIIAAAKADEDPCVLCARSGRKFRKHDRPLHMDHIKPIADYPELQYVASNVRFLCEQCHGIITNQESQHA